MSAETFRMWALLATGIIGTSIAIIGFLVKQQWAQLQKSNEDLRAAVLASSVEAHKEREELKQELRKELSELKEVLRDMKADLRALDNTDRQQGRDILELTVQYKYLQEYARKLEDKVTRIDDRHEEFGKFLSWKFKFKRAEDPKPAGPDPKEG